MVIDGIPLSVAASQRSNLIGAALRVQVRAGCYLTRAAGNWSAVGEIHDRNGGAWLRGTRPR